VKSPRAQTLFSGTLFVLISLLVLGCGTTDNGKSTAFPYQFNQELLDQKPIKKVIFASSSFGVPTKSYLIKGERKVKSLAREYLKDNGFTILPDYHFQNAWKQATRNFGDAYDPTTGKINMNTWRQLMTSTAEKLRNDTKADAIIFVDVIEVTIQHSPNLQHLARWDGVIRKPTTQGIGAGVPVDFEWAQPIKGASVQTAMFTMDLQRIFSSRGGIEPLQAVDLRHSEPAYVRKKKPLRSDSFIEEGIQLAFHPLIEMDNYPGLPAAATSTK